MSLDVLVDVTFKSCPIRKLPGAGEDLPAFRTERGLVFPVPNQIQRKDVK